MSDVILKAENISKTFEQGSRQIQVLKNINLEIKRGDAICIMGASGAGKSTLLQILGTLDRPTSGDIYFQGQALHKKSDDDLSIFRNRSMGFVFQFHHLMNEFTALENVMMPSQISGLSYIDAQLKAKKLLSILGLSQRYNHFPNEMSGGEQQRVAIARALVMSPKILLADEPTGNLDSVNGIKIQDLFFELKDKLHLTLIVVTHDAEFAKRFPKVLHIKDGQWS